MKRKIVAVLLAVFSAFSVLTACSSKSNSPDTEQKNTVATQEPTLPPNINPDKELARVSTIDKFFNARSITLNEKVLRFSFDDAQMKYVGFTLAEDNEIPEKIAVGETVENIKYIMQSGLTAYVSATNQTTVNTDYTRCKYNTLRLIKGESSDVVLHLPNQLTWDSKADVIKKEYGQPKEENQNENGDTVLTYKGQSKTEEYTIELTTAENGIKEVFIEFHAV